MRNYLFALLLIASLIIQPHEQEAQAFLNGGGPAPLVGCSYTPPLDANPAAAAYSYRVLSSAWIGQNIVRIQRSSDSTQKTFTATAPGCGIDTSDAFFDGSTYTVVTKYDQSGHGADVTQATNSNRPVVTLNCQNGHPCETYTAASSQKLTGTLSSSVGADTFAVVGTVTNQSVSRGWITVGGSSGATNYTGLFYTTAPGACASTRIVSAGSIASKGTKTCTASTWYRIISTQNNTLSSIYLNGVIGTDETTSATLVASSVLEVGNINASPFQGSMAEQIVFSPDLSISNSNTVSSNQGAYWGL